MPQDQNIILEIEGDEFLLIGDVEIVSSMLNICDTFTAATMHLKNSNLTASVDKKCKLMIDDEVVIDGQIDLIEIETNTAENLHELTISGRDKTADLVDCTFEFEPNEWKETTLEDLINNLCTPFEIDVFIDPSAKSQVSNQIETFKANEGEYVIDSIAEICRNYAVLPVGFGDGRLTLTQAGTKKTEETLHIGSNVIWSKAISSNLYRYSDYYVKGHDVGNDNKTLSDYIEPNGYYADGGIKRTRPFVIFADGPVDSGQCELRAQWEACIRAGFSRQVIYKYDSFYQKLTSKLWKKNSITEVVDPVMDIEGEKLIAEVRYILSGDSRSVFLTCVSPDTFTLGDPSRITGIGG